MAPLSIPRATYRLQLHAGFTFADAEALVPYLAELGISHLYLSPFFKARPGSLHGYDVVDHNAINPEIGDMAALERLHATLQDHAMGIILDIVPNHVGVGGADNPWWLDVLEWGEDSPYARFFDIDWNPARVELKGRVLLPFLGEHYGIILERGELIPKFDPAEGTISIWYWEHRHPIAVRDYAGLLDEAANALGPGADGDPLHDLVLDFRSFARGRIAGRTISARRAASIQLKERLAALATAQPAVKAAIDGVLAGLMGRLPQYHALMERQSWRLSYWRVASDEINYRRFFDINDLAALRMVEEPELFERAHKLVLDLVRRGMVQGLRIDHVDGLFNPAEYCRQLQRRAGEMVGRGGQEQPIYLLVEKILAHHEPIRRDWPVAGSTGYEFTNLVGGLFVDGDSETAMTEAYGAFTGFEMDFDAEVYQAKKRIIDEHMASELRVLAVRLGRIAVSHWRSRDFTLSGLYNALKEVVACLPVYRTYVTTRRVTDNDRRYIDWAVAKARRLTGDDPTIFDFLAGLLSTDTARAENSFYSRRAVIDFAMRLQQYTGPVMAKGFEDTALYRYNRLICLNEVGGEPTRFGLSPQGFHQANRARLRTHPHSMLATATHDSKRGEDTRVRIAALSAMADDWRGRVERWRQLNASFRKELASGPAPEANDEYFLYQTLAGAWTDESDLAERLASATIKAVKEAKRRTSWAHPDEEYEQAVADFVHRILETDRKNPFLEDFRAFHGSVAEIGMVNGLAQILLKMTAPGVPDFYQGTELWDLALVDPDNRRPVDYQLRRRMLGRLAGLPLPQSVEAWRDGAVKQELIRRTLDLRRRKPALFADGAYRALQVRGPHAANVLAFARQSTDDALIIAVPVRPYADAWKGVYLEIPKRGAGASDSWRDLLSGREISPVSRRGVRVLAVSDVFASFPLALLEPA